MKLIFLFLIVSPIKNVVIVHTNNMYGVFYPRKAFWMNPDFPPPLGGAPSLATYIENERKKAEKEGKVFLLFDAGDFFGGNLMGENADTGRARLVLNGLGYDAACLGVHDFVIGAENLRKFIESLNFPILAANLTLEEDTLSNPDFVEPYIIIEKYGLRVGVFGLISEYTPFFNIKDVVRGFYFRREIPVAREMVKILKSKGVDIIIALTHIGDLHEKILAREVKGIDVIIGGFMGRGLREPFEDPETHTIISRTYGRLADIGELELVVDTKYGVICNYTGELITLLTERYPPDPKFAELLGINY